MDNSTFLVFISALNRYFDTIQYNDDIYDHDTRVATLRHVYAETAKSFDQPEQKAAIEAEPARFKAIMRTSSQVVVYCWPKCSLDVMVAVSVYFVHIVLLDDSTNNPSPIVQGSNCPDQCHKYGPAVAAFTVPRATLATVDHDVHRLRRSILNPYFSKRAVTMLEPLINGKVDRLCGRLEESIGPGTPVDLDAVMAALTADIVTVYFYGKDFDYLGGKDFRFTVRDAILGLIGFYHFSRFSPSVVRFINSLPIPIVRMIQPGAAALLESQEEIKVEILQSLKDKCNVKSKSVIVGALGDPDIPVEEKTVDRLVDEGVTVIFAGTETTARSISVAMFYLLRDNSLLQKLRDELSTVRRGSDGQWAYSQLEILPYLTGCVQEGLRLAHGPVIRLPRVSPNEALQYDDWLIPAGTPVSESTVLVHLDPSIFPNPDTFDPDRWVRAANEGVHLKPSGAVEAVPPKISDA
ncbi:hypothetical protein CEP54_010131 [Fusarium duplospermum]|uniref:Cytochrome P450 monooxygenase n=1 Tax=Fusarium duplospermum TaxID=1325734 RepID=A0A428PM08_9HYPO|nr:hypothetical protein CEP54_010131 [Fusarium duplospermum]